MSKSAKTAVITRTKDRPILLERALKSVLSQADPDWVLSLVNDGGSRETVESLLDKYRGQFQDRLVVTHNPSSVGMEAASNLAIRAVDSEHLVIHDDDDAWDTEFLSQATSFLAEHARFPAVKGVVTGFLRILERIEGDQVVEEERLDVSHWAKEATLWQLCGGNLFPPISFLYKRDVLDEVGYYREDLPVLGYWEFNLRFARRYDIVRLRGRPLAFYHHRSAAGSSIYENTVTGGMEQHRTYTNLIRNDLLRKDLDAGELGLGYIVNEAMNLRDLERTALHTEQMVSSLYNVKAALAGRLRKMRLLKKPDLEQG